MQRVPEPELMDDPKEAEAYAVTDFSDVNQKFVDRLVQIVTEVYGTDSNENTFTMVDLGCGPGDITNRVRLKFPNSVIVGIDGSPSMLNYGMMNYSNVVISWIVGDAKNLPLDDRTVDIVFSNSLLHHLYDPTPLWLELSRVVKKGGIIFLRDLYRPDSPQQARAIVEMYAGDASELLKEEYYRSLLASFIPEEVQEQLRSTNLSVLNIEKVTDRHMDIYGVLT